MNFNLVLGVFALGYGLYTLYARTASPAKFGKLEAMKKQWGERGGTIIHVVGYTVMPIIVGLVLIVTSLLGGGARSE